LGWPFNWSICFKTTNGIQQETVKRNGPAYNEGDHQNSVKQFRIVALPTGKSHRRALRVRRATPVPLPLKSFNAIILAG
jgi:hypothetical protein